MASNTFVEVGGVGGHKIVPEVLVEVDPIRVVGEESLRVGLSKAVLPSAANPRFASLERNHCMCGRRCAP
jgi:hypothetical protein